LPRRLGPVIRDERNRKPVVALATHDPEGRGADASLCAKKLGEATDSYDVGVAARGVDDLTSRNTLSTMIRLPGRES
jgi:hypothetical protein